MNSFQKQRTRARIIRLNADDLFSFDHAPDYIINSFFDNCTYKKRLTVVTFCFVNGIQYDDLLKLIRWKDVTKFDYRKVQKLWSDSSREPYKSKWFAYNCHLKRVIYLNGALK